ncbi:MAG: hypothetical protein HKN68_20265, partial [Saprospiraceae bacterium]|nr:hypothetical protein [Saprospiraceae bacterium]
MNNQGLKLLALIILLICGSHLYSQSTSNLRKSNTLVNIPSSPGSLIIKDNGSSSRSSVINNHWVLTYDGANYNLTDENGSVIYCEGCEGDGTNSINFSKQYITSITVEGGSGDDVLTIREENGQLPQPASNAVGGHTNAAFEASGLGNGIIGVHFEGGAGWDELIIQMDEAHDVTYFSDNNETKSGVIDVAGEFTLSFDGLEPIVIIGAGGSLILDASSTPATSQLDLMDLPPAGDGLNQVTGDGGWETVTFSGFFSLIIRGGDGSETMNVNSVDGADPDGGGPGAALSFITLDGDNVFSTDVSSDVLNILDLPATISCTLSGAGGSDNFNIGSSTNSIGTILGLVTVDGETHDPGTVDLQIKTDINTLDTGDILNVNDQGDAGSYTYSLSMASIARTGTGGIVYFNIETLNLNTSIGSADVDVISTADGVNTTITTQDAADDIDVAMTGLDANVIINVAGGADDVNIVTTAGDGADGNALGSFTQVNAGDDGDTMTLEDSGPAGRVEFNGQGGTDVNNILAAGPLSVTNVNGGDNSDTNN